MHPFGGATFNELHGVRDTHRRRKRDQQVDVVRHAANLHGYKPMLSGDAAEERPEAVPEFGSD